MYLAFIHPRTWPVLERLGWRLNGRSYADDPVIGIVFGTDVTFWETGLTQPALRVPYSQVDGFALAQVERGIWSYPSIGLKIVGSRPMELDLALDLRTADLRSLGNDHRERLIRELNSTLLRA